MNFGLFRTPGKRRPRSSDLSDMETPSAIRTAAELNTNNTPEFARLGLGTPADGTALLKVGSLSGLLLATAGIVTAVTYEEGTWTPVVSFSTPGTLSVAYTVQQGRYIRVGSLVVAWLDIGFTPTLGTASGNFVVLGLPATIENVMNIMGTLTQGANAVTLNAGATTASFVGILNSTSIAVQDWGSATARASWTTAHITTGVGRRLTGLLAYRAA